MFLEIITPENKLYEGKITYAKFPGSEGEFGVLNNHAPIISNLSGGHIEVTDTNNEKKSFKISGGVVEILENKIIVLAD